jgi:hypothetical protein
MPSFREHGEHSRHNLAFLNSFFLKHSNDWAVTVMFYASVHMVESLLEKSHSLHCRNHQERSSNLPKLASFPTNAYKALERKAHDSRYTSYKVFDWEAHQIFKDHFQTLARWFNTQAGDGQALDIQSCMDLDSEWYKKYQSKDPECNKCH